MVVLTLEQRIRRYCVVALPTVWVVLAAFSAAVVVKSWPDHLFSSDFVSFWTGASLVRNGVGPDLFRMETQRAFQEALRRQLATSDAMRLASGCNPFHNPPPLALLLVPLTPLPITWAYLVWSAASLVAFFVAVWLPLRRRPGSFLLATALLAYPGVAVTLMEGQVNGFCLLAFSLGLMALALGHPFLGGLALGVLLLKPQFGALFPLVFLAKGRWRELAGMATGGLIVAALSLAIVGPGGVVRFLDELQRIGTFYPPPSELVNPVNMSNWRALLMDLWPGIPGSLGSTLVLLLGTGTALASLLAWRGEWNPTSLRFARQMMVTSLATLIASPHNHFHGTVLVLAPLALALARRPPGAALRGSWFAMVAVGYVLAFIAWPLRGLSWLLVPYALVAMAMLLAGGHEHPQETGR